MAKLEIINKLSIFLDKKRHSWEEQDVVYFFVEVRKIFEQNKTLIAKYKILYFYCNWVLHWEIDRNGALIQNLLDALYKSLVLKEENWNTKSFVYMEGVRIEIEKFLKSFEISYSWVDPRSIEWEKFVVILAKILNDQKLRDNNGNIKEIRFTEVSNLGAKIDVIYKSKEPEYVNVQKEVVW